jgi:hypothetical protein
MARCFAADKKQGLRPVEKKEYIVYGLKRCIDDY